MSSVERPEQQPQPKPSARGPLLILFLTVFVDLLGFGIVIPFLPMYAARMHIGAGGIGLILAIYSLMQFICAPILGRISDRVGRRPIIMLGLIGSSIGYVIYGFANSFALLLISRAVHGMFAATVSTAQAYVADSTEESKRAHWMGMIGAAFGLGFVLGPGIGGLLGHSSLRTPVFFAAALTFANFIFAALRLPESHTPDTSEPLTVRRVLEPIRTLPSRVARNRVAIFFVVAFMVTFVMATLETTFALMVPQLYGYGAAGVGGLFAFAGFVQALTQGYLLGKLVKRVGELKLLRIGIIAFAIGIGPLASVSSHALLFVFLALVALGYGFASPSIATLISKRTERHMQGEVLGINQSALSFARIVGPIAAGFAYQALGPAATYIGGGIIVVLALLVTGGIEAGV